MTQRILPLIFGALIGLSLGLVGGGGSILTVPILVYAIGQPAHVATTTSLAIVGANALVGAAGVAVGVRLAGRLPQRRLTQSFAGLIVLVAAYVLYRSYLGLA